MSNILRRGDDMSDGNNGKVCCFTGHRKIDADDMLQLPAIMDRVLDKFIDIGVNVFRAGGAIGFDMIAALKVLEKRRSGKDIKLELYLPCRSQADRWDRVNRETYDYILAMADKVIYVNENYTRGCMLERNRRMVEGCNLCIAFCQSDKGGSAYTIDYAKKQGLYIMNVAHLIKK